MPDKRARRAAPTGEPGDGQEPQGAWRGAGRAVGRRRALGVSRATDAPVEGGLRAPG